jgi:hypothetical protein
MQMQVADMLDEQSNQLVGVLGGPAPRRPRLTNHAFHDVATCRAAAGDCALEALGPVVVEA